MQDWLIHLLMGLIQGLTEFLPVSSSGHLLIAEKLFGFQEDQFATFAVLLHASTALAVIVYLWQYICQNVIALFSNISKLDKDNPKAIEVRNSRALWRNWLISSLMLGLLLPAKDYIKQYNQHDWSLLATAGFMLITATLMITLDRYPKDKGVEAYQLPWWKALLIGLAQDCSAMLRGLSRSGTTVFSCVALGMNRQSAAKFSFVLSLSAIGAAVIADLDSIQSISPAYLGSTIIGCIAAFVSGMIGIHYLLKILVAARTSWFGYWCIIMSIGAATLYFLKLSSVI